MEIIELLASHWEGVRMIYLHGIATKQATFQTEAPTWEEWDKAHLSKLRYVAIIDNVIAGWAVLSPVSSRCVYSGVTEVSVYIHEHFRGKGIGKALLQKLITESEANDIWTLKTLQALHCMKSLILGKLVIGKRLVRWTGSGEIPY